MFAALLLTLLVVVYRVVLGIMGTPDTEALQWLHNFSPLAAVALCGAAYFPQRLAWALPLGALLVSDLCLNAHYGVGLLNAQMLPQYAALGLVVGMGWVLRQNPQLARVLLATVASSVLFYVVTNTGAWLALGEYPKTGTGWMQALTTGLPGHAPTWVFFRNSLVSDVTFTGLFVACLALGKPAEGRKDLALAGA